VRVDSRAVFALAWAVLLTGCVEASPTASPTTATTPPPDPVDVCTNQLAYWAAEDLRGAPDRGFDYQHRGLTGAQADALRALVDDARARQLAPAEVRDRARAACTDLVARPPSTGGPWP
jgi:hypothetical protein